MGRIGGNPGNKGGGRKTKAEEKQAAIQELTELALLNLAKNKVKKYLDKNLNFKQTKEMALPIVVKGMAQKIGGDPDNRTPIPISNIFVKNVQSNNGNEKNSETSKTD